MSEFILLRAIFYGLGVSLLVIWWTNYAHQPQWYRSLIDKWAKLTSIESGKPFTCPFCMSVWLSVIAWLLMELLPLISFLNLGNALGYGLPILCGIASSAVVSTLVSAAYDRLITITN